MDAIDGKKSQSNNNSPSLQLNHPRINGLLGIENSKKSVENIGSKRFSLKLFSPDDKVFPEFNYQVLTKSDNGVDNGKANFDDSDDTNQLKALAKKFEDKYGPTSGSGKKEKLYIDEFVDAGYGYDESDTFIDNSEAYDEIVPSDWTTEHGGFYINQGNLGFRPLSTASDPMKKELYVEKKKKKALNGKKIQIPKSKILSTQKKKMHLLSKEKQRKRQESLQKAHKILVKKSKKAPIIHDDSSQDIPLASIIHDDSSQECIPLAQLNSSHEDNIPLAKIAKSSSVEKISSAPATKSCMEDSKLVIKTSKCPSIVTTTSPLNIKIANTSDTVTASFAHKIMYSTSSLLIPTCSIVRASQTILSDSVANKQEIKCAGSPLSSQQSSNGVNNTRNAQESNTTKTETPLPPGLSQDLLEDIKKLKAFGTSYVKGKCFFTKDVNKILLSFATACRQRTPKIRLAIYDHVLCYLPCAKDTLVKRCRSLVVQHQRDMEMEPMKLLKHAIADSMIEVSKKYNSEVANALQEQAREQIKQTGVAPVKSEDSKEATMSNECNKMGDEAKKIFPKKKYVWSDNVRKLLCDVLRVRVGLFKMSKSKSLNAEEYIKDYLESEIRKLWPKGWMTSRILYKESRAAHLEITQTVKKKKAMKMDFAESATTSVISLPACKPSNTPVTSVLSRTSEKSSTSSTINQSSKGSKVSPSDCTITSIVLAKSVIKPNPSSQNGKVDTVKSTCTVLMRNTVISSTSTQNTCISTHTNAVTTSSVMTTLSGISHTSNRLRSNVRVMNQKPATNGNWRFIDTIEKTTFMKPDTAGETYKQRTLKIDQQLCNLTSNEFSKNVTSPICSGSSISSNAKIENSESSGNAKDLKCGVQPSFVHIKSLHTSTPEDYYKQIRQNSPIEVKSINDNHAKRNVSSNDFHNYAGSMLHSSQEGKSRLENDLVRLTHRVSRSFMKDGSSPDSVISSGKSSDSGILSGQSPDSGVVMGKSSDTGLLLQKSPDFNELGKEWSSYSNASNSHVNMARISQSKNVSQLRGCKSEGNIKSSSRSPSSCSSPGNLNYMLSNKQSTPPNSYQLPTTILSNTRSSPYTTSRTHLPKSSTLKPSMDMVYSIPQHPASRIQATTSKSDHSSSLLYGNSNSMSERHSTLHNSHPLLNSIDSHVNNNHIAPLRHPNQKLSVIHDLGMRRQGKLIGLQPTHPASHPYEELYGKDVIMPRNDQDYSAKFGNKAPHYTCSQ